MTCDHKFVDSDTCAKCGWHIRRVAAQDLLDQAAHLEACNEQLRIGETELRREFTKLATILADAVDLLRDWEDYEPGDPQCTWATRRDEFLKEHEPEGR